MYTCPRCGGTGIVGASQCPRCFGNRQLVEDSQGLNLSWGGVSLGKLTNIKTQSPVVSREDVTGLNAQLVTYTGADGSRTHTGLVKSFISGDITPAKVDVSWIGKCGLVWNNVGSAQLLVVTHSQGAIALSLPACLLQFSVEGEAGSLISGSASFEVTS